MKKLNKKFKMYQQRAANNRKQAKKPDNKTNRSILFRTNSKIK